MPGEPAREDNAIVGSDVHPRAATEEAAAAIAADGVNVSVVRLPQVHDTARQGLITPAIAIYREKGACAYIGDGTAIAGRRRMFSTLPASTDWRSKRPSRTPSITRSRKKAYRCATLPKLLADA